MRTNSLLAYAAVTIGCGLAVWAGCGSDESTATPGDGDGGASSSGGSSSGTTSSSGAASSSGGSSSGGTNDGGDGGGSSSGGGGDGGVNPPDAGPGGDTTKLTCGATTCALPAQQCCVADLPGQNNIGYGCAAASDAGCPRPDGGGGGGGDVTSLKCSGAANCPANTKCCVRSTNGGASSECKADCGNNEAQLCDPNATTTGCPQQDPCSNDNIGDWGLPNTYATCGGQGN